MASRYWDGQFHKYSHQARLPLHSWIEAWEAFRPVDVRPLHLHAPHRFRRALLGDFVYRGIRSHSAEIVVHVSVCQLLCAAPKVVVKIARKYLMKGELRCLCTLVDLVHRDGRVKAWRPTWGITDHASRKLSVVAV